MSFVLLNPATYSKFFLPDGTLTFYAGLSMLGGVLSFVILWSYNLSFQTYLREDRKFIRYITSRKFLLTAMLFSLLHVFFMGYKGWVVPAKWHGGLPPISLIAFVFFVIGYTINLLGRKQVID
jgi:membrane protease YdiL (CAAX protease family)